MAMAQRTGPKHFSMIRGFHLADFITLANAACGVGGLPCHLPNDRAYFPGTSGTNRTGSTLLRTTLPSARFSMTSNCCASKLAPTGITMRPPGLSC